MKRDSLLREVTRLFGQIQRDGVACCGSTGTQCTILTELGRGGPMTLVELSRRVGLDKGWTSRAVEALVQEGLVSKTAGETDRRTVRLALSAEGEARFEQLNQTLNAQAERVLARVPAGSRPGVTAALATLREALKAEAEGQPVLVGVEGEGAE